MLLHVYVLLKTCIRLSATLMPHPAHKYMECGTHGSSGQTAPLPVEGETGPGSEAARSHNTEETPARVSRLNWNSVEMLLVQVSVLKHTIIY